MPSQAAFLSSLCNEAGLTRVGVWGRFPRRVRVLHNVTVRMQPAAVVPAGCGAVGAAVLRALCSWVALALGEV